jgi:hypothetical protein
MALAERSRFRVSVRSGVQERGSTGAWSMRTCPRVLSSRVVPLVRNSASPYAAFALASLLGVDGSRRCAGAIYSAALAKVHDLGCRESQLQDSG